MLPLGTGRPCWGILEGGSECSRMVWMVGETLGWPPRLPGIRWEGPAPEAREVGVAWGSCCWTPPGCGGPPAAPPPGVDSDRSMTLIMSSLTVMVSLGPLATWGARIAAEEDGTPGGGTAAAEAGNGGRPGAWKVCAERW